MQRLIDGHELEREMYRKCIDTDEEIEKGRAKWDSGLWIRYKVFEEAITLAPTVKAIPIEWIPITTRPMKTEERLEWEEEQGFVLEDDDAWIYTSQLPDDGQEVLVCGKYGAVWIDKFMNDPAYGCWLAETGDLDGIVAWMPLPEPYGEEEEENE